MRELCKTYTDLSDRDITLLETAGFTMQHVADLTGSDVFIDCMRRDKDVAVVVAHARPCNALSAYGRNVLGQPALPENEPAVYLAFESGLVVRDLKAITQEHIQVRQDVSPIRGTGDEVIGVLILEKDVSGSLRRERKYRELSRKWEYRSGTASGGEGRCPQTTTSMQEIHHRVKNNLQLVASIMNIQARKAEYGQFAQILRDNVGKVLSIASIHDILTTSENDRVDLSRLIEKICEGIRSISTGGRNIAIQVDGDGISASSDQASSIALVVHELVSNALEHAFTGRQEGNIRVTLRSHSRYGSITVEDDGGGLGPPRREGGLGNELVMLTVREKLCGELRYITGPNGTKVIFDFQK